MLTAAPEYQVKPPAVIQGGRGPYVKEHFWKSVGTDLTSNSLPCLVRSRCCKIDYHRNHFQFDSSTCRFTKCSHITILLSVQTDYQEKQLQVKVVLASPCRKNGQPVQRSGAQGGLTLSPAPIL